MVRTNLICRIALCWWVTTNAVAVRAEQPQRPVDTTQHVRQQLASALSSQTVAISNVPQEFQDLATAILREQLPDEIDESDDWGDTKRIWAGVKIRRDGLRLRTHRKWKEVNHGTWTKYHIQQIDPEKNVTLAFGEIRELEDGRVAFPLTMTSMVNAEVRVSEWNRGVQLVSLSMNADAHVAVTVDCTLETKLNFQKLPPDVQLVPRVTQADIRVSKFETHQISKLDGKVAEELGRGIKKVLDKKLDEKRPKLVAKINRQLEKKQDKLTFSAADFVGEKWSAWTDRSED
ncbi:MAG: hypothetical protein R3C28_12520 [Pirellulaceae bacterium]